MARQLSIFSAETSRPRLGDLAGLLCGPAQVVVFARATARLSLPVTDQWRANALVKACAERGVAARVSRCEETGETGVGTAFRRDLAPLAAAWTDPGGKAVPPGFLPDGGVLRMWVLAAGRWTDGGYLLPVDPAAPATHGPLAEALERCGLPTTAPTAKGEVPGLRVVGRRRLGRLLELVGPPAGPGCADVWPAPSRMRVVS
ncbi:hypothetical protein [Actinokineospora bangkokensis]|uniref:Uncharacterized protein n=1 Tax=Actinokineospora bangkokensis TaxID=1193682 RepID=A0A1Q9LCH6_9PSEU|nr:hypothetical protein [Actinokineospora bangkokensis]OLR89730.1 hypothetical protein BJP25_01475 [Actinokineospora bangkokensis]